MSSLPPEVLEIVEFTRLELIVLHHLRARLAPVQVKTLVADNQTWPLVLIRRTQDWGYWSGDPRFIDSGTLMVDTFAQGLEADNDCRALAEAARVILRDSVNVVVPTLGHIKSARQISSPRRVTDWATGTGPVQYADLPSDVTRYESTFDIAFRPAPK